MATPLAASLSLALLAWVVHIVPGASAALEFKSGSALREPWRLLTGHLTHFALEHLMFDSLALVLLGTLARSLPTRRVLAALLGAALAIPLAMELVHPEFASYRGLSGLDATLFAMLLIERLRGAAARCELWRCGLLTGVALAGIVKLSFEFFTQQSVFVDASSAGFVPAPLAHALGALAGILAITLPAVSWRRARLRVPRASGRSISPELWSRWGSVS